MDLAGLTSFYSSVLQAWQVFNISREPNEAPGVWLLEEPLFFNRFIRTQTLQSASLRTRLREVGCTKLGHLVKMSSTASAVVAFRQSINIASVRLTDRIVKEVCAATSESSCRTPCSVWPVG